MPGIAILQLFSPFYLALSYESTFAMLIHLTTQQALS